MIKTGDIVYFLRFGYGQKYIDIAVVNCRDDWGRWHVDRIGVKEHCLMEGIPIKDFSATEWRNVTKEIKNRLHEMKPDITDCLTKSEQENLQTHSIKDKTYLQKLYYNGLLTETYKQYKGRIELEVSKDKKQYRWVSKAKLYPLTYGDFPDSFALYEHECFDTYDEAKNALNVENEERKRVQNLSDVEFSIEIIDKTLQKFPPYCREELRSKLFSMGNIENLDVKRLDYLLWYKFFKTPLDKCDKYSTKWQVLEESRNINWDGFISEEEKSYNEWVNEVEKKLDEEYKNRPIRKKRRAKLLERNEQ